MNPECVHCGRPLDVDERTAAAAEEHTGGDISCPACLGLEELPEEVPACDHHDCERPAPFSIETTVGEIRRCRHCLLEDLERGWFEFYDTGVSEA